MGLTGAIAAQRAALMAIRAVDLAMANTPSLKKMRCSRTPAGPPGSFATAGSAPPRDGGRWSWCGRRRIIRHRREL